MTLNDSKVSALKARANGMMKNGKFVEAIMEYSEAISLQPSNAVLYSNRSLAFLKLEQFFFAMKDAETTIRLVPDWAKGYYRKGQAELAAEMFDLALSTYASGLRSCPCDDMLMKGMDEVKNKQLLYTDACRKTVRRYTVGFALIGLFLVIMDTMRGPNHSVLNRPIIRFILVSLSGTIGYVVGSMIVSFHRSCKASLLQPPPELLTGTNLDYLPTAKPPLGDPKLARNKAK